MTEKLLDAFGSQIARLSLRPSSGGRYEVTIDGELVYSKKATGKHPPVDAIIAEVRRRLRPSADSQSDKPL